MKKNSIFIKILIPLIGVMVLQLAISNGVVFFGGTMDLLINNSLRILQQNVNSRKNTLEGYFGQQWPVVEDCVKFVEKETQEYLQKTEGSYAALGNDSGFTDALLENISEHLLLSLRKTKLSGIFVILAPDAEMQTGKKDYNFEGLFFRDLDPGSNPKDYSDILLERGPASVSSALGIRMDSLWDARFRYQAEDGQEEMPYLFKPLRAAAEYSSLSHRDMGYWSTPLYLNYKNPGDSHQMITFSVPLLREDNVPYGVVGIEISTEVLADYIPSAEIDPESRGGYLLATFKNSEEEEDRIYCQAEVMSGSAMRHFISSDGSFQMVHSKRYHSLYEIMDRQLYNKEVYSYFEPISLYNNNAPYADEKWAILGIANREVLFGISDELGHTILICALLSLVLGAIVIYVVSKYAARPIESLVKQLRMHMPDTVISFEPSKIYEIDQLVQVINEMRRKQKKIKADLERERERYLLALESATDTILEYDTKRDTFVIYQFIKEQEESRISNHVYSSFLKRVLAGDVAHAEDTEKLVHFLQGKEEEITIRCKTKLPSKYHWFTAKGRPVYNKDQQVLRVVGSTRNITAQKEDEFLRQEENKRDIVTKLFKKEVGEEEIKKYLLEKPEGEAGCLCMMDLDNFQRLNNQYGILYCDILLEEIGSLLAETVNNQDILVRIGGDEFLLYLKNCSRQEAARLTDRITEKIQALYVGEEEDVKIGISIGTACHKKSRNFQKLYKMANAALGFVKTNGKGFAAEYSQILLSEIKNISMEWTPARKINEISSVFYEMENDIISITFHLFEKTRDVKSTIPVLLGKLGRQFAMEKILFLDFDEDFYTSHISYQWEKTGAKTISKEVFHTNKEVFMEIVQYYENRGGAFLSGGGTELLLSEECKKILYYETERPAYYCAMYENGNYVACAVFYASRYERIFTEQERDCLQEIVKIVSAHISKSKADLASRAKSEFLSRMSHEIRTPMNAIIGMTNIAMTLEELPDKCREYLEKIDVSASYLLSLINDILDMSRIESGKLKLIKQSFSLDELIGGIEVLICPQAEKKGVKLCIEKEVENSSLIGDSLRLNQVLINLLSNAIKFTNPSDSITIEMKQVFTENNCAGIYFAVKDTGIGISEENVNRIFNVFEQADDNTEQKYGGTGLGLSISSNIVRMMGGKLEVKSRLGQGSSFYFTVQFEIDASSSRGQERMSAGKHAYEEYFRGKRILLVEDNDLNIEIAHTILEMTGFLVEEARDGKEAAELFASSALNYYDVILMDIRMPVMNGLEATKAIRRMEREDAATVPIIAMTANAFDEDMKKSIDSGMNGHLAKPFDKDKLYELLEQVLSFRDF